MKRGDLVRLIGDPGRVGHLTGRERERGGFRRLQVRFSQTTQYVPEDQLELVPDVDEDPIDLLAQGRLGQASDLRRVLTHVRLSGRLANVIYSMDTTDTDFYAYQFKPVVKLLNSICTGILIADEVGLGKTIEAGLLWTELRSRFEFRRLMVLCPAVLKDKWRIELERRFGVEAHPVDAAECLARLERADREGVNARFALIGSLQGLRPRKHWRDSEEPAGASSSLARFLQDHAQEEPLVDLLIVDEAHYMRNRETMTADLGRLFRDVSQYVVLLTATPIHLGNQDLFQLVNLVDEENFDYPSAFDEMLRANEPLVKVRDLLLSGRLTTSELVENLQAAARHPLLQTNRQIRALLEAPPTGDDLRDRKQVSALAQKLDAVNLLGHVVSRTRKRDVTEWRVVREPHAMEVPLTDPERDFYNSVTQLVRRYCRGRGVHEGFLLVMPQRQMCSSMPAAIRSWQERQEDLGDQVYEDFGDGSDNTDDNAVGPLVRELVSRADDLGDYETLRANDSKYRLLREGLDRFFHENPKGKLILFSYFRATLDYLRERLEEDGTPCLMLRGGVGDKTAVVDRFRDEPGPRVLLSSEVGSEGIDLQFCWAIINYDLPWNPMRVEQRIGRVDRLGQQSPKVSIWNLFYEESIDSRIYHRLLDRLGIFEKSLGGLEPILGEMIRDLAYELLRNDLTPEQEAARIEETAQAAVNIRAEEERLEGEAASLVAYGDYILNQVKAARELSRKIDDRDLYVYVRDFLNALDAGSTMEAASDHGLEFTIDLSTQLKHDLDQFIHDHRLADTTRLTRGAVGGITYRFENSALPSRGGKLELISQFHPLIRFIGHRMSRPGDWPHPVSASLLRGGVVPAGVEPGTYVFSVQQWSVRGVQDIEKLYFAAARIERPGLPLSDEDAERLVTAASTHGTDWVAAANVVDLERAAKVANDSCMAQSDTEYDEFKEDYQRRNLDRADLQLEVLEKRLSRQKQSLTEVLDRHRLHGRNALAKATEGRIKALENRIGMRRIDIQKRRNEMTFSNREIAVGLVLVEG